MLRALHVLCAVGLWLGVAATSALAQQAGGVRFVTTEAEGSGMTREAAVAAALASAVEQVTGTTISSRQAAISTFAEVSSTQHGTNVTVSEAAQQQIARVSGGIVRSYRVLETRRDRDAIVAVVEAEVAVYRPTSPTNETRRSLVVSGFTDEQGRRTAFGEQLRERLIAHLTQSRRFNVLDRANDAAYAREMAVLATDAPMTERARVGQVLGADYIVVGRLRNVGQSQREEHVSITGERIVTNSARANLEYQVLEIATRQVRWAATVQVATGGNLAQVLDTMVARIGREITQTIYPLRLIRMDNPLELILNQGGVTVEQGQRFRAMLMGDELVDPYTRESLGRVEREIGIVEIMRVDPRVSYGRLASGTLPPAGADVVLRPAPPAPPRPRPAQQGGSSQPQNHAPAPRLPF